MFEWEWRDLHEASFLSDSLLVQVAMSSAGHNVGLCHANACNSENIHVTSIITKLQPFSNGTAKKWLAGPQER